MRRLSPARPRDAITPVQLTEYHVSSVCHSGFPSTVPEQFRIFFFPYVFYCERTPEQPADCSELFRIAKRKRPTVYSERSREAVAAERVLGGASVVAHVIGAEAADAKGRAALGLRRYPPALLRSSSTR